METLVAILLREYPAPDKEANPFAWVGNMNMLIAMAQTLHHHSCRLQNNLLFASLQLSYQKTNMDEIHFVTVGNFPEQ